MTPTLTNIMKKFFLFFIAIITIMSGMAVAGCKDDCILKNRSQDQNCDLEKTPLTRCEKFSTYVSADKDLNNKYKILIKTLSKDDIDILRKSQRNWLEWRLEKCDEVDEKSGCDNGVCAGVAHDACIISTTKQRTDELTRFKEDPLFAKSKKFTFSKE